LLAVNRAQLIRNFNRCWIAAWHHPLAVMSLASLKGNISLKPAGQPGNEAAWPRVRIRRYSRR
jgi:hypothetical protein